MDDHDRLTRLQAQLDNLQTTIAANNNAAVERDTRIETKVDRINGTVRSHEKDIDVLQRHPVMPISEEEAQEMIEHNRELWTVYRIGRWVALAGTVALLGQTAALIGLVFHIMQGG